MAVRRIIRSSSMALDRREVLRWYVSWMPVGCPSASGRGSHDPCGTTRRSAPWPEGRALPTRWLKTRRSIARRLRDFCGTQVCSTLPCGAKCNGRHAELVNSGRANNSLVHSDYMGGSSYRRHRKHFCGEGFARFDAQRMRPSGPYKRI